ncbi:MAG: alpha/beta fold hydrolase [Oligoflexales bacterium]|nr:alpha/beta fold hydrolase [Oligoflexales bacterium]
MIPNQRPKFESRFFNNLKCNNVGIQNIKYTYYNQSSETNAWYFTSKNERALVLFLHATGHDALYPNTQLFELLLNNGFSIFSFDLDGHGFSSTTFFDSNDFDASFDCAFNQVLKRNEKTKPIFVCGQSLGALLGFCHLGKYIKEVKGFVGIAMPLARPNLLSFLPELLLPILPTFWQQLSHFSLYEIFPPVLSFKRQFYPIRLNKKAGHYFSEISAYISNAINSLQQSQNLPQCLFIKGQFDKIAARHSTLNKHLFAQSFDLVQIDLENHFSLMLSSKAHQTVLKWLLEKIND